MKGYDESEQKDQAHMMHCPSFVEYAYITETSAQANPDPASISLPNTFKEAKASSHSAQWTAAMNKELASLKENDVYDLIFRGQPSRRDAKSSDHDGYSRSRATTRSRQGLSVRDMRRGRESTAELPSHRSAALKVNGS